MPRGVPKKKIETEASEAGAEPIIDDKILARLTGKDYKPGATLAKFHASEAFVRGIRGPVGSGKSTGMCQEILRRAREQAPASDGIRHSRFVIVRNTYGELKDTTVKTWLDWVPEEWFGKFNRSQGEMKHPIRIGDIDCEVLFRALDKPDDVRKVLSLELTGAWVNEAREIPKQIIDALGDRVGRYPPMRDGGATWSGVMLDTNPPDEDHWWFHAAEEEGPKGWEFFTQPGGLIQKDGKWIENPEAENTSNLPKNYYATRAEGKREDYIRVYYAAQYGYVQEGKPVFPEYSDALHGAKTELQLVPGKPVFVGIGLGLESGALFGQKRDNGQWLWLDELMPEQGGAVAFADLLSAKMKSDFPAGTVFRVFAKKPANSFDQDAEAIQIMRRRGIFATYGRLSDATLKREAVAGVLSRLIKGEPALMVSPKCRAARKAMTGGFCYARIQAGGEERYHDEPVKNRYAIMGEAAEHMLVGGGEDAYVFRQPSPKKLEYKSLGIV